MTTLMPKEIEALHEALDDEYKSFATYEQVIADFGDVRPFINICDAEGRHIAALTRLFCTMILIYLITLGPIKSLALQVFKRLV